VTAVPQVALFLQETTNPIKLSSSASCFEVVVCCTLMTSTTSSTWRDGNKANNSTATLLPLYKTFYSGLAGLELLLLANDG
jgi:hypothetical protein